MNRREFARTLGVTAVASAISPLLQACAQMHPAAAPPSHEMGFRVDLPSEDQHIAMLLYPGFTALDLVGPQKIFASLMKTKVHLVAKTKELVTTDTGLAIRPTATFAECPDDLTVLFVPGGGKGTVAIMSDEDVLAFLRSRSARARYVTSVCTGSLVLAAAGLLRGYRATSHWATRDLLARMGAVPVNERVVEDRNRITGAGVTAGIDFGLRLAERLRGADYAKALELNDEYDPQPPYRAGTPELAGARITTAVRGLLAPTLAAATQAAVDAGRRIGV
jgi:cyclohexyl-isocyanide hydratase